MSIETIGMIVIGVLVYVAGGLGLWYAHRQLQEGVAIKNSRRIND